MRAYTDRGEKRMYWITNRKREEVGDGCYKLVITGCTVSPASRMLFISHAIPYMAGDAIVHGRA